MNELSEFLRNSDLYLTLTNNEGETYDTGMADKVKSLKSKTIFRWKVNAGYTNVFPFTLAVLHSNRRILDALYIKPILPNTETVIELVY